MAPNTTLPERVFMILPRRERSTVAKIARRDRRSWTSILDALIRGEEVFLPDEELNDDGKYLRTALTRRGRGERLRTTIDRQDMVMADGTRRLGVDGRRLWIERS